MPESFVRVERPTYTSPSITSTSPPSSVPGGSIGTSRRYSASCSATAAVSGRRASAPGRVTTASSSTTTAVSSTNTASGSVGAAGSRRTVAPSSASRRSYSACSAAGRANSIGSRASCVSWHSTIDGLTGRVRASSIRYHPCLRPSRSLLDLLRQVAGQWSLRDRARGTVEKIDHAPGVTGSFGGETRGDARPVLRRTVLAELPLPGQRGHRDLEADDRRQHALDVARRCIGHLPGLDALCLVAIGQGFEKAAQPSRVLVPRNGALCVHHGVVPGRHDLAVSGLGGIPAWAHVVIRALEDCEHRGPAGDHAPDGVGARYMSAEHTVHA